MLKITKNLFFISFALLSLSAVSAKSKKAKTQPAPEWINSPSEVFPLEQYLSFVGSGADRNSAEAAAINGLAGIFGQHVQSSGLAEKRMEQAKAEGKVSSSQASSYTQNVLITVDQDDLTGVEVKEYWFDGNSSWYAVALIDRSNASELYSAMIKTNNEEIENLLSQAKGFSMDDFACVDFASDVAAENEKLFKRFDIINLNASKSLRSESKTQESLRIQAREIAKKIPVYVSISGDINGKLTQSFKDALSSEGFSATTDSKARYTLTGKASFTENESKDKKTVHCRYSVDAILTDTKTGEQLYPFTLSGREGHTSYGEAQNRALKSIEKKISGDFDSGFGSFLK